MSFVTPNNVSSSLLGLRYARLSYEMKSVSELPGWSGVKPPNCFLSPLTHCQIMYWGVSYTLYTYNLHNFGRAPTVEKFNPS